MNISNGANTAPFLFFYFFSDVTSAGTYKIAKIKSVIAPPLFSIVIPNDQTP
jgi:hypothetical protein